MRAGNNLNRKEREESESSALIRPRPHRGGQPQYHASGGEMHPLRNVQGRLRQFDGRARHLHPAADRRKRCLHLLRTVRQRLPGGQHRRAGRMPPGAPGHDRPRKNRGGQHLSCGPRRPGRGLRDGARCLCGGKNGGPAPGPGRRLRAGHQLCRGSDHCGGGQRADPPDHGEGPSPSPVHQLLPRLGALCGDLRAGAAAPPVHRQKPHRHAGPHGEDLLRQKAGAGSPQDRPRGPDALHRQKI